VQCEDCSRRPDPHLCFAVQEVQWDDKKKRKEKVQEAEIEEREVDEGKQRREQQKGKE
jgi:hypothetical protein